MAGRRVAVAVGVATLALLAGACGSAPGGDPGNRRLHELSRDAVFAELPPSARGARVVRKAAFYYDPGIGGGSPGWSGPSVVVTFTSSARPAAIYRFYARRAAAARWRGTSKGRLGLTDVWKKTYPDGARAWLGLYLLTLRPEPVRHYMLAGSAATVSG